MATAKRGVRLLHAGIIAIGGIAVLWLTIAVTLAMTLADPQPGLVLSVWPSAVAQANAAFAIISSTRATTHGKVGESRAMALAAAGLVREPVLAGAASTLGAAAALDGDRRRAIAAYAYAQRLSRRDLPSQLWWIERAVSRGDIASALAHYDIALRMSQPTIAATLLPVMVRASANAAVRDPLITMLRRQPNWRVGYLQTLLAVPLPTTVEAEELAGAQLVLSDPTEAMILSAGLNQLVQAKQYHLAAALVPGTQGGLRNGSFEKAPRLLPFDWWFATDNDLSSYREPDSGVEGAYVLRIATKDRGGVVARQLVALQKGQYILTGRTDSGTIADAISITCVDHQSELIKTRAHTTASGQRFALYFAVPDRGCDAQWLTITLPPAATVAAWVDALKLKRLTSSSE